MYVSMYYLRCLLLFFLTLYLQSCDIDNRGAVYNCRLFQLPPEHWDYPGNADGLKVCVVVLIFVDDGKLHKIAINRLI